MNFAHDPLGSATELSSCTQGRQAFWKPHEMTASSFGPVHRGIELQLRNIGPSLRTYLFDEFVTATDRSCRPTPPPSDLHP
jgi:hypothetical protein